MTVQHVGYRLGGKYTKSSLSFGAAMQHAERTGEVVDLDVDDVYGEQVTFTRVRCTWPKTLAGK